MKSHFFIVFAVFLTWKGHHRQRSASPANCFAVRLRVGDLIFAGIFAAEARVSSNEGGENMGMRREIYGYMDYYRIIIGLLKVPSSGFT